MFRNLSKPIFVQLVVVALGLSALQGCKPNLLPNTNVRATRENRVIVDFVNQYKKAVESRSADAVMALVAADYFDAGGNNDPADDVNRDQLEKKLRDSMAKVKELTLKIIVQNIERNDDMVNVVYYFSENALVQFPSGEKWTAMSDVNRMVLRLKGRSLADGFEIVSGL